MLNDEFGSGKGEPAPLFNVYILSVLRCPYSSRPCYKIIDYTLKGQRQTGLNFNQFELTPDALDRKTKAKQALGASHV